MKAAVYTNNATNEVHEIYGDTMNIEMAWNLVGYVCLTKKWNPEAFTRDVTITIENK